MRAQILEQQDQPNPIEFTTPEGRKGRVWLAADAKGKKIIGDDRHWRAHVAEAIRLADAEAKPRTRSVFVTSRWI